MFLRGSIVPSPSTRGAAEVGARAVGREAVLEPGRREDDPLRLDPERARRGRRR